MKRTLLFALTGMIILTGCAEEKSTKPTGTEIGQNRQLLTSSLHNTTNGMRYFYSSANGGIEGLTGISFDALACRSCHVEPTDCADCHATEAGGGTPEDAKCLVCHTRQGAEISLGYTDEHRSRGFKCADCHDKSDVHGDGQSHDSMLSAGAIQADCSNAGCHTISDLPGNIYHSQHVQGSTRIECAACHVQSVVTCYNCHFESEVQSNQQVFFGQFRDWKFLVKRGGKVALANLATITYHGKGMEVLAPYYAHTVARNAIKSCDDCHDNAAVREYRSSGTITLVSWDEANHALVQRTQGIIPVPGDWKNSLRLSYAGKDESGSWIHLNDRADGQQMLFAEPLDAVPHPF